MSMVTTRAGKRGAGALPVGAAAHADGEISTPVPESVRCVRSKPLGPVRATWEHGRWGRDYIRRESGRKNTPRQRMGRVGEEGASLSPGVVYGERLAGEVSGSDRSLGEGRTGRGPPDGRGCSSLRKGAQDAGAARRVVERKAHIAGEGEPHVGRVERRRGLRGDCPRSEGRTGTEATSEGNVQKKNRREKGGSSLAEKT